MIQLPKSGRARVGPGERVNGGTLELHRQRLTINASLVALPRRSQPIAGSCSTVLGGGSPMMDCLCTVLGGASAVRRGAGEDLDPGSSPEALMLIGAGLKFGQLKVSNICRPIPDERSEIPQFSRNIALLRGAQPLADRPLSLPEGSSDAITPPRLATPGDRTERPGPGWTGSPQPDIGSRDTGLRDIGAPGFPLRWLH